MMKEEQRQHRKRIVAWAVRDFFANLIVVAGIIVLGSAIVLPELRPPAIAAVLAAAAATAVTVLKAPWQ